MPKISITVPIYNVEKYLEKCIRSLFSQTLDDIEYIFVNDCSTDNSMSILCDILNQYPERKKHSRIINHENNLGLLATRLDAFRHATGEYIACCDSDDWVESKTYELLYNKAKDSNSEIVIFNYIKELGNQSQKISRYVPAKNGLDLLLSTPQYKFEMMVWGYIFKNDQNLILGIPPLKNISMWEDVYFTNIIFSHAKKIIFATEYLYHYNKQNNTSILSNRSKKDIDDSFVIIDYINQILPKSFKTKVYINYLKFVTKEYLLYNFGLKEWRNCHKECHKYILQYKNIHINRRILYILLALKITYPVRMYLKHKGFSQFPQ